MIRLCMQQLLARGGAWQGPWPVQTFSPLGSGLAAAGGRRALLSGAGGGLNPGGGGRGVAEADAEVAELNREMESFFGAGNAETVLGEEESGWMRQFSAAPEAPSPPSHQAAAAVLPHEDIPVAGVPGLHGLTHVDDAGKAAMVDVTPKGDTVRSATASGRVLLGAEAYRLVASNQVKKGDVLTVAQLAGIQGAKMTSSLIPLCHNILIRGVDVKLTLDPDRNAVSILATAKTVGPTGVEMEALTAASVAGLTVYDMCKAVSKDIEITDIKLQSKSGGKSADYVRPM